MAIDQKPQKQPSRGRTVWLTSMAIAILAGIFVPYGLLAGSDRAMAVLIFWLLFGVVVIGLIVIGVMRWRDET